MRYALLLVLIVCGCPSKSAPPVAPKPIDDTAVRIRIAYAEARRSGGLVELAELAANGAKHERILALRGLGRIGGAAAVKSLRTHLADSDADIIAAAAAAIGLAASLDDEDYKVTADLVAALPRSNDHAAVIEALGRAGDASAQSVLRDKVAAGNAHAALALGRHGRRKIALADDARDALAKATSHASVDVRYAATYALAREHITDFENPRVVSVVGALSARLADSDPEVRAVAVSALARRKQVKATAPSIEQALIDKDWRVAVEAVRALSGDEYRKPVLAAAVRGDVHMRMETLRQFIGKKPADDKEREALAGLTSGMDLRADGRKPRHQMWQWVVGVGHQPPTIDWWVQTLPKEPTRHLDYGLLADWVKAKGGSIGERRIVLRAMLGDTDVRVRAAAMPLFKAMWADGDDKDHEHAINTIAAAISSKDPILSGSAIEAADEIYELVPNKEALAAPLVFRADGEKDVELATSLYGIIGKRAIGSGATACKQGLAGHPVLVKAAVDCLKKLGDPVELPSLPESKPPFVDVTAVIGKTVKWRVQVAATNHVHPQEIVIELRPDVAPWAVATIVTLTRRGYYDGLEFHRVVPNFVVQGGDPTESGWGGPGFMIPAEPGSVLDGHGFVAGGVGIADAGRDSGGSQWFVMHSRATHLDGRYTWIGSVVSGGKSADALVVGDEILKASVEISDR